MKRFIFIFLVLLIVLISACDEQGEDTPVINSFSANPASVSEGDSVTLSWDVSNASSVSIDNGVGNVEPVGSRILTLEEQGTYTYTLTAWNGSKTATASVTVSCINAEIKLQPSPAGIYHSAFVFEGNDGWEDAVTKNEVTDFEALVGKQLTWGYFSNNWFSEITFPADGVNTLKELGRVPFIRLMARHDDFWGNPGGESLYTMQNIIDGMFDTELRTWARAARDCGVPLLVEFGTEVNGDWFPWNGRYHGGGTLNGYGDPNYPDGPERFRDAYRHIIQLFREEGADNITWFFHVNNYSIPNEEWNQYAYYYPGDDYIDWLGISVYGPQTPDGDYETFTFMMDVSYPMLCSLSADKPVALLEYAICEGNWSKADWIKGVFDALISGRYPRLKAISWWNEDWENEDGSWSDLKVNSSVHSLEAYRNGVANAVFIAEPIFSGPNRRK